MRFIQLSDIHFHYSTSGSSYDLDDVIRHELVLDAASRSNELGGVYGVLVSGDIAFSGRPNEYATAYNWLSELCREVGCSSQHVWTIPGNHDVDRSKIRGVRLTEMLHKQLRRTPLDDINSQVRSCLEDSESRKLMFAPLEHYNAFAANFGCCSTADPLYWTRDLSLNDNSKLRLWGMNSALVSDEHDREDFEEGKLILSSFQTNFKRADDVVHLTMCHHPLDWLRDRNSVMGWFDTHARVQLFGHRHVQRIVQVGDNIRIAAGAMHPDRGEAGWEPRYNFINLEVIRDALGRRLRVEVHPRVWNDTIKEFVLDSIGAYARELLLREWQPVSSPPPQPAELTDRETLATVVAAIKPDLLELERTEPHKEVSILNAGERLTSRYMGLPHNLQLQIARNLELLEDEDKGASDTELYRRYFRRAKDRRLLERLWKEVEGIYVGQGEEPAAENPFAGR